MLLLKDVTTVTSAERMNDASDETRRLDGQAVPNLGSLSGLTILLSLLEFRNDFAKVFEADQQLIGRYFVALPVMLEHFNDKPQILLRKILVSVNPEGHLHVSY